MQIAALTSWFFVGIIVGFIVTIVFMSILAPRFMERHLNHTREYLDEINQLREEIIIAKKKATEAKEDFFKTINNAEKDVKKFLKKHGFYVA